MRPISKWNELEHRTMKDDLKTIIGQIGEDHRHEMATDSRHYCEVSIGQSAERLGYPHLEGQFRDVYAIVPLKRPAEGMKVRIDGRTFVDYAQFDNGLVVPGYLAKKTGLPFKRYVAQDSMILNFT
jgi:hypothetical protein